MTKTPPRVPPPKKTVKIFEPKTIIMFSTEQAQKLANQLEKIRKEHPELFNGPLGDLINLIK